MAKMKLSSQLEIMLSEFDKGESPANLATKYGVHSSTIRRYIKASGRELNTAMSHIETIEPNVKSKLKRVLHKYNINNLNELVSELDLEFNIEIKEKDIDFIIVELEG